MFRKVLNELTELWLYPPPGMVKSIPCGTEGLCNDWKRVGEYLHDAVSIVNERNDGLMS